MDRRRSWLLPAAVLAASTVLASISPAAATLRLGALRSPATAVGPRQFVPHQTLSPAERGIAADVPRAVGLRDLGRIGASSPIEIGILLRARNEEQLKQLTLLQGNHRSPFYHHYLTSEQFNNYFAPTEATYDHAKALLVQRGFRITGTYANHGFLRATAPAAVVERYFSTELHSVVQTKHGQRYTNVTPAIMPQELRDVAVSISGLHSIVTMRHPMQFADRATVLSSATYALERAKLLAERSSARRPRYAPPHARVPFNVPTPLGTSTPGANPSPDPGITPGDSVEEYVSSIGGYGPDVYVNAYDYPVEHGYGGRNHAAGSVIEADFLNSDMNLEFSNFGIPRSGKPYRECWTTAGGADCYGTIGASDPEGESTLDALTIMSMAPASDFYEYLAPQFDDIAIEGAYELAINQNVVDAVNSSFGGCETDDPSFGYATNYIAMEGAALGISFEASTGDTGATNCGIYAMNGAPQSEINTSLPSSDDYFTAVGGTDFYLVPSCTGVGSDCYTLETGWTFGGGGYSVFNPVPSWQAPSLSGQPITSVGSQTMRNTPDVVFSADELPPGAGISIYYNAPDEAIGGTSVASPMWTALQVEINQVQHSRNGFVNPGLYAVQQNATEYAYAFRDITGGVNVRYVAIPGYDDSTGIGSPLGWELASVENGDPGATPLPIPPPTATPAAPTPTPTASPTPVSTITPHPVGNTYVVTTIAGNGKYMSIDGTGLNASFDEPTGVAYTTSQGTDPVLFINDFSTGFLRSLDLTTGAAVTENNVTWNNATREAKGDAASKLFGLGVGGPVGETGLYETSVGDSSVIQITLPTTPNATVPTSSTRAESGTSTVAFNTVGNIFDTSATLGDLYAITFLGPTGTTLTFASSTALPVGNNGLTTDGEVPESLVFTNAGTNVIEKATELPMEATVSAFTSGAPLNMPEEITMIGGIFYVANCGGNNIVRVDASGDMTVVAGDGAPRELDGKNTGAEFNCPFGITNDGTNLYVTDFGGNTIRKITGIN